MKYKATLLKQTRKRLATTTARQSRPPKIQCRSSKIITPHPKITTKKKMKRKNQRAAPSTARFNIINSFSKSPRKISSPESKQLPCRPSPISLCKPSNLTPTYTALFGSWPRLSYFSDSLTISLTTFFPNLPRTKFGMDTFSSCSWSAML